MKKFLRINNHDLTIDLILADYQYPILFTCTDEENNMYITTCFYVGAEKQQYLVAETSPSTIKELLTNKRTIRDVFPNNGGSVFLVTFHKGADDPTIEKSMISEIDSHCLPTAGIYMDAEKEEFSDELAVLEARIELQKEKLAEGSMQFKAESTDIKILRVYFCKSKRGKMLDDKDYRITKRPVMKGKVQYA